MGTIVTVHGTHAHTKAGGAVEASELQWWQPDSTFEKDMRALVEAGNGKLEVKPFVWSGNNSEVERREAGRALLSYLQTLEARSEPYSIVAHSHGGSVVSAALLAAAAKKRTLPNLKRWTSVGTPFVSLKRELFLFTRLGLLSRVAFVASMMLLIMFLVSVVANVGSGQRMSYGGRLPGVQAATAALMSLPAILLYLVLRYIDGRRLMLYRRRIVARAKETFGPRWLSLAHSDDEAIQGLAYLPSAKLQFFDRDFAVSAITGISVIALPLIYVAILLSPATMVGIADLVKARLYEARSTPAAVEAARTVDVLQRAAIDASRKLRQAGQRAQGEQFREIWRGVREKRRELQAIHPDLAAGERTLRFRQRFFERTDIACDGRVLCGGGNSLRVNSGLILHLATDELSWSIGAEDQGDWRNRQYFSLIVAAVLVPVISALIALVIMLLIRALATGFSHLSSSGLNSLTNAEVKRAAFGNDTDGEIATGASDRPPWLDRAPPRLPAGLADLVTKFSDDAATKAFGKLRAAIGRLAFAEQSSSADSPLTNYFTWKELVHSAYFDVPQFRKLVALAVSRGEGFAASAALNSDPERGRTAQWLAEIEGAPKVAAQPGDEAPGPEDVKAVSAVIAATVKAEP